MFVIDLLKFKLKNYFSELKFARYFLAVRTKYKLVVRMTLVMLRTLENCIVNVVRIFVCFDFFCKNKLFYWHFIVFV